jgi:hypothetical protein
MARQKHRLQRPPPREIQVMKEILEATDPRSGSLTVRNVRDSARRGLQLRIPQVLAEGNDSRATAAILGLPVASVEAVKTRNRII